MMHREIVAKKKVPAITMILLSITAILYMAEGVERSKFSNNIIGHAINFILITISIILIFIEIRSCLVSYKYSIIADKLIINLVSNKEIKTLKSIKMSDILYIGKKANMPKEYLLYKKAKSYLCNRVNGKYYYCVYKNGDRIEKIKFQPSDKFINRILRHGELKCNLR